MSIGPEVSTNDQKSAEHLLEYIVEIALVVFQSGLVESDLHHVDAAFQVNPDDVEFALLEELCGVFRFLEYIAFRVKTPLHFLKQRLDFCFGLSPTPILGDFPVGLHKPAPFDMA